MLLLARYFFPGFRAGGPIRSIVGIIELLSQSYKIDVLTTDRDFGDKQPFPDIQRNRWQSNEQLGVDVFYSSGTSYFWELLRNVRHRDVIYINSFFDPKFSIIPLLLSYLIGNQKRVILAPRGEFSLGALGLKSRKKKLYLFLFKLLKLQFFPVWHATNRDEKKLIHDQFGNGVKVLVAENIAGRVFSKSDSGDIPDKKRGQLKLVFLARICKMKNLKYALNVLKAVSGQISFSIYGPIEDQEYWNDCLAVIQKLPPNITVTYLGEVRREEVIEAIKKNHVMILPTLGENFGHIIAECLQCNRPVILSDRTSWSDIETFRAGWTIPLESPEKYTMVIEQLIEMTGDQFSSITNSTEKYWQEYSNNREGVLKEHYNTLFAIN